MSTPHYQMSAAWDEQRVAPQLEQEYELGSSMYGVIQHGPAPQQALGRQQQSLHNSVFNGFDSSYQQNLQQQFNFNLQQSLGQGQQNHTAAQTGQAYYQPTISGPSSSSQQQNQPQQYRQPSLYQGRSPAIGGSISAFQDSPVFPQFPQQGVNGPSGYGSSPQQFPQSFSPEVGIPNQNALQHPYLSGTDRQAEMYSGPSFKRPRTMDDRFDFDQDDSSDREAGPAPDVVKAKAYVYAL
ncbi:hypothetical protein BDY19DRAFT_697931 [Irpex rosettiformis]|uniref:Uncharacterized protein n=1 Tax=Irpex rosettiformis TaxID=378272 RepID=A0ACB8UAA9_9APHY|nr:hypothetical protein BDY19DRAFT_697931 [Irpex rosettiformis]